MSNYPHTPRNKTWHPSRALTETELEQFNRMVANLQRLERQENRRQYIRGVARSTLFVAVAVAVWVAIGWVVLRVTERML